MARRAEFIVAAALLACLFILNIQNALHQEFNSDEPAHLHIIWAWTRGFVQYRDIFSNNMPLFHITFAPIFGLIGERATILYWMRLILPPAYFVTAWCTYQIGAQLFSRRAGLWAVIGLGFYRPYHFFSSEFRTDNLWAAIWLLCITVLIRGRINVRRALVAGLLLGLCFAVSMKSALLLVSLAAGLVLTFILVGKKKSGGSWPYVLQCAAAFLTGAVLVPATTAIFFALKGVWHEFRYGVFDFNLLANTVYKNHPAWAVIFVLPLIVYAARQIVHAPGDSGLAFRRTFIFFICTCYIVAAQAFWPSIGITNLPVYSFAFVMLSGALLPFSDEWARRAWGLGPVFRLLPLPAFVALAEFVFLLVLPPPRTDIRNEINLLRDVLVLTDPGDYVLDCKGETIFRRRCFRPTLERITVKAIEQGIMTDTAPEQCIVTHTSVVATAMIHRFSPTTRQFIEHNYLPVTENLRVAGVVLQPSSTNPHRCDFEVVIAAPYKLISRDQNVSGVLDGTPYDGARFLEPGPHTFESASASTELFLLWSQAVDRGFTPFARHTLSDSD